MAEFGASRSTVRRVVDRLESEGAVYRIQGAGTFVAPIVVEKGPELTSFSEDMRRRGMIPSSRVLAATLEQPSDVIAARLGLSRRNDRVWRIRRLRLADGDPMCIETSYIPEHLAPDLPTHSLDGSLYDILAAASGVHPTMADQTLQVRLLDSEESNLLELPRRSAGILVDRLLRDQKGEPMEFASSVYRGDRYTYHLVLFAARPARANRAKVRS